MASNHLPGYDPSNQRRNRWKSILVIGCALLIGILLGLMFRNLI